MPRKTKTQTTEPAVASVVEPEVTTAPKKTKTTKTAAKTAKTVSQPPVADKIEPTTEVKAVEPMGITEDFTSFMTHLQQATSLLSSLKNEFRALEKKATRELKAAQKVSAKRKRKSGNRSPSGFVKPTLISNELAAFLGKDQGTEMARTDVTREINSYIRANGLQDPQNGRKINADSLLTSLLKLQPSDELTYFNLQKYMSPHFQKQADKLALLALEAQKKQEAVATK